ncbi:MAG: aminotransferase class IV [Deltaproteobacteria bacterium]|nr:aminotransferase class IV [Deltaproteobacteria bacterium]
MKNTGVFETIRYKNGQLEQLAEHLDRLKNGCKALGITVDLYEIERKIIDAIEAQHLTQDIARVRLIASEFNLLISAESYQPLPKETYFQGIRLLTLPHPQPNEQAKIKSQGRPGYEEALKKAQRQGYDEALLLHGNEILECSTANILVSWQGKVLQPPRSATRLSGVTEEAVLREVRDRAQLSLPWPLHSDAHVYITSSMRGILPVRHINDLSFPIDPEDPLSLLIQKFWPHA